MGLNYEVNEHEALQYTNNITQTLDERYLDYKEGIVKMISAEESQEEIKQLFAAKK